MNIRWYDIVALAVVTGGLFAGLTPNLARGSGRDSATDSGPEYATADVVVQYGDGANLQFKVADAETVARLASHFPGILGDRGSGPRTGQPQRARLTIKFQHKSGDGAKLRVAHVAPDYATWWWRDNTPYTGSRQVERKDELRRLFERLAAKNKADLK